LIFAAALALVWVATTLKIVTAIIDPVGRMRAWHSSFEGRSSLLIADVPRRRQKRRELFPLRRCSVKTEDGSDCECCSPPKLAWASRLICTQQQAHQHIAHQYVHVGAYRFLRIRKVNPATRDRLRE
jgi:hypothetical protein